MSVETRTVPTDTVDPARLRIELNADATVGPADCIRVATFPGSPDDTLEMEFTGDPDPLDVDAVLAAHPSTDPIISKLAEITSGTLTDERTFVSGVPQILVGWVVPEDSTLYARGAVRLSTGVTVGQARGVEVIGNVMCARDGANAPSTPDLRSESTGTAPGLQLTTTVSGNVVLIWVSVNVSATLPITVTYDAEAQANP